MRKAEVGYFHLFIFKWPTTKKKSDMISFFSISRFETAERIDKYVVPSKITPLIEMGLIAN